MLKGKVLLVEGDAGCLKVGWDLVVLHLVVGTDVKRHNVRNCFHKFAAVWLLQSIKIAKALR
jgi:hypothetical protein